MGASRYPRPGYRLAPATLRDLLEDPLPPKYDGQGGKGLRLADLDESAWQRFDEATCRELGRLVISTVARKIRTPALGGNRLLPPIPEGLTLSGLELEPRTINCLVSAGIHERPQDLRNMTLDAALGLRGFWVKSLVDLLSSLEHVHDHPEARGPAVSDSPIPLRHLRDGLHYPRAGRRLAPQLLRELLIERVPKNLATGTPFSAARLCDLDETVWKHLPEENIAKLAAMIVARARMAGYHRAIVPRRLPQLPAGTQLRDLQLEEATYRCLAGEGFELRAEGLGKLTIGDLLLFQSLNATCLVDLLTAMEAAAGSGGELDPSLTAEAEALREVPSAAKIRFNDPRLGSMLRSMDTEANCVGELVEAVLQRRLDPPDPRRLAEQFRTFRERLQQLQELPLDEELSQVFDPGTSGRDREILAGYYGWDGQGGCVADAVGRKYGLSRERIRQVCDRAIKRVRGLQVFAPAMDRALALLNAHPPARLEKVQTRLDALGTGRRSVPVESLRDLAEHLSRPTDFTVVEIGKLRLVTRPRDAEPLRNLVQTVQEAARKCWPSTLQELLAKVPTADGETVRADFARQTLPAVQNFHWLDKRRTWFRMAYHPRFGLASMVIKVLAVAAQIEAKDLCAALGRCRRRDRPVPPLPVLLEYCRRMPGVEVRDSTVISTRARNWRKILAGVERTMVRVLRKHGPLLERAALEEHCIHHGMNRFTFSAIVTCSPVVVPYQRCLYGLVGAAPDPKRMAEALGSRPPRPAPKVLRAYGQTKDGRPYLVYRLSKAVASGGIVAVPVALQRQLEGNFTLHACDGAPAGTFCARNGSGWGLGPGLRAMGARQGDHLLLVFDLDQRAAHMRMGDGTVVELAANLLRPS